MINNLQLHRITYSDHCRCKQLTSPTVSRSRCTCKQMRLKHSTQQRITNTLTDIINIQRKREVKDDKGTSECLGCWSEFLASWSVRKKRLVFVVQLRHIDLLQLLQQSCGGHTRIRAGTHHCISVKKSEGTRLTADDLVLHLLQLLAHLLQDVLHSDREAFQCRGKVLSKVTDYAT